MASNKNNEVKKKNSSQEKFPSNAFVMKVLVFLGVCMLFVAILYLMYYFFVKKSNIEINMSTDKRTDYIEVDGKQELITTQKYVSDLEYSIRYDIDNFTVFKYKKQDIFKFIEAEKILLVVEQSEAPDSCSKVNSDKEYTSCVIKRDDYTEEYYFETNTRTYKITVKTPNPNLYSEKAKSRIQYMLNSFEMTTKK